MSDKNVIGIRLKCLEMAVDCQTSALPMFPQMEVHVLAEKFKYYVETGEWDYNTNKDGENESKNEKKSE